MRSSVFGNLIGPLVYVEVWATASRFGVASYETFRTQSMSLRASYPEP